jgi:predicted nucleotide-binding protein
MSAQHPKFVHTLLDFKLQERLADALGFIANLSHEDVLRCDTRCLTELVREFAVAPPILRSDLIVEDEQIVEESDLISGRKTGRTLHIHLIPIEREAEWLEEVSSQQATTDGNPLAFLDHDRGQISIRLVVAPEDDEGTLKQQLDHRKDLVEQYAAWVAAKLVDFNKDLAEHMTTELDKRKSTLERAKKEQEIVGLPRVYNPEDAETAERNERVLGGLGRYVTGEASSSEGPNVQAVRSFIVHGHENETLLELKNYLQNTLGMEQPIVLREQPGLGKTMIEKFEREAEDVGVVFVLLTPDDEVVNPGAPESGTRRARQNVILELGFFLGRLGRESGKILLLHKGPIEIPSDIAGIEYIDITNGIESAGEKIRRELQALGVLR